MRPGNSDREIAWHEILEFWRLVVVDDGVMEKLLERLARATERLYALLDNWLITIVFRPHLLMNLDD